MPYPIRVISAEETFAFRQVNLWPDMPIEHVMLTGDDAALHLGAFDGETLIGLASFFRQPPNVQLRKLAVASAYRGQGLGAELVQHGNRLMREEGFEELWCDARVTATGFYEALGFEIDTETFEKTGLLYKLARIKLIDHTS